MPPQIASSQPVRGNGFSLVEMMVVLFVMGLLASVVVLAMPGSSRELRTEAERFAARASAARDEAIVTSAPVSLVVGEAGYYFERRADGRWQPMADAAFGLTPWTAGTNAAMAGGGRTRVVFDTVGLASSDADLRLTRAGQAMRVHIARDGKVQVDAS